MNHCTIQQQSFVACDDMRVPLICPTPRRIGQLSVAADPTRSLRLQTCQQADDMDLKARVDFLDIFMHKGGENQVETSPFFCGSPPTRSDNPLIHDTRFVEATDPVSNPNPVLQNTSTPVSARSGFDHTTNYGFTPAMVRIEGFNCVQRDHNRDRRITAFA